MTKQIQLTEEQVAFLSASLEMTIMSSASIFGPFSDFQPIYDLFAQVDPKRAASVSERLQEIRRTIVDSVESVVEKDNEEAVELLNKLQAKIGKSTLDKQLTNADNRLHNKGKLEVLKGGKGRVGS